MIKNLVKINSISTRVKWKESKRCNIHVMPPTITDDDITALFNGILNVMRKKIELETRAEIINMNVNIEKIMKQLNEKNAECIRLKNEILYLKSKYNTIK